MDYEKFSRELEQATLFDLWRIKCTIDRKLDDPQRLSQVKRQLKVGMNISYFEDKENRLIDAEVIGVRRTRVSVRNLHDQKIWDLPLYMLNLGNVDADVRQLADRKKVERNSLKVGDRVGWAQNIGEDLYGVISKLNPAKAVVKLPNNDTWRVPYSMLFVVMDGELDNPGGGLLLDSVDYTLISEE